MKIKSEKYNYSPDILESIFKYSKDEIILTDENFNITFHNSKLINSSQRANLFEVINFITNKNIKKQIIDFSKSDASHLYFRLIVKHNKSLENIPISLHICKIKGKKENGYCIIIQDILQEVCNRIQKATFVDIISHDLKIPMRANIQILELILKNKFGNLDNSLKQVLKELLNSCRFMNYMADNLLIKYKNELELKNLKLQKYSVVKLIKEACNSLSKLLEAKKQSAELTVKGDIPFIQIDIKEMTRVINNLIINASEQSCENSKIYVSVENSNNKVLVAFTNYGYKQNTTVLNEMFEEYLSCSNKFRKVGFGLELYNCKRIIEAHKGNITVKSMSDKGTSIIFCLPLN